MNRTNLRKWVLICVSGAVLLGSSLSCAHAIERSLLGIRIYAPAKAVLKKFGNPTFVLTAGQVFNAQSNSVTTSTTGNGPSIGPLPAMQPSSGPVAAFGAPQLPQSSNATQAPTTGGVEGEVTLVYEKSNGLTYQFLLAPNGSVVQITALGYHDSIAKTSRAVTFGTNYTTLLSRYGYPENQSESNGVRIVDYSRRAHVAFELLDNAVVGIVVAAVD